MYHVLKGEVPTLQELEEEKIDFVIVPGSPCHVYDAKFEATLSPLYDLIRSIYYNDTKVKLLGVCFGA
jgi:GMP synthase-like glutamine amidotransferase